MFFASPRLKLITSKIWNRTVQTLNFISRTAISPDLLHFQVIQVISSERIRSDEEVDLSFISSTKPLLTKPPDFKAFFLETRPWKRFSKNVLIRGQINPLHRHKVMSVEYQVKQNFKSRSWKLVPEKSLWKVVRESVLLHNLLMTPVAGLFIKADDPTIFLKRISEKNFKKSALLVLQSGLCARRRSAPRQSCRENTKNWGGTIREFIQSIYTESRSSSMIR